MTQQEATFAITGSTGRLGGLVARRLAAAGVEQTLLVRDLSRAPELPGATAVTAAFGDRDAVRGALQGIDRVLMVSAAENPDRLAQHLSFVDAAVEAGVRHLVYTSFVGAAPDATFTLARDHWATEEHIRASGVPFTFLRDNLYADFTPQLVGDDGVIRGPGGDGRVTLVAQDDIADAATAVLLTAPEHAGSTHDLTGPRSWTLTELAVVLSESTGRPITYVPETLDEAYRSRAGYGAPDWQLDAWVSTYLAIAAGELDSVNNAIELLTRHPATPLETVLASRQVPRG